MIKMGGGTVGVVVDNRFWNPRAAWVPSLPKVERTNQATTRPVIPGHRRRGRGLGRGQLVKPIAATDQMQMPRPEYPARPFTLEPDHRARPYSPTIEPDLV